MIWANRNGYTYKSIQDSVGNGLIPDKRILKTTKYHLPENIPGSLYLCEVVALLTLRRLVASWNADCFWHHSARGSWLQFAVHPWNVDAVGSTRLLVAHNLVDPEALLDRDPLALSVT